MKLDIIVYTMEGCSHCENFKKLLEEANITYYDRDVFNYQEEYDMYVKITKSEFIPSLLLIETDDDNNEKSIFYAADRDFVTIHEGLSLLKKHII
jgi:glutaredoxin